MTAQPHTGPSTSGRHPLGTVYLLHFDQRYEHAGHYTGFADDLPRRLRKQATGRGAKLVAVALAAGCQFELVWLRLGTRDDERRRKNLKAAPRLLCPLCPARPTRSTTREFRNADATQGVLALAGGGR